MSVYAEFGSSDLLNKSYLICYLSIKRDHKGHCYDVSKKLESYCDIFSGHDRPYKYTPMTFASDVGKTCLR